MKSSVGKLQLRSAYQFISALIDNFTPQPRLPCTVSHWLRVMITSVALRLS